MARPSLRLINALRKTAEKLRNGAEYQWGHMGTCNCGNLVQELTAYNKDQIHRFALEGCGDWNEQLNDYCPHSGLPMDNVIEILCNEGLSISDLKHLERLSDQKVLKKLPPEKRFLKFNLREDVIIYLEKWADILEDEMANTIGVIKTNQLVPV